jgi:hypothetical protein
MPDISGTLRKVTIDGTTFDVMADTNVTEMGSNFLNEAIPTSGRNMRKIVTQANIREGIVIACNGAERELLVELNDRQSDYSMSYEDAGGDVYRTTGWISFENRETEENRATIQMHSRDNTWDAFLA